jgi:hypothetical protein
MVNKTKQTLLEINTLLKNPSKKLINKHSRLKKAQEKSPNNVTKMTNRASFKLKKLREKEERDTFEGGQGWLRWLSLKGFQNMENMRPDLLYKTHGSAPSLDTDPHDLNYSSTDFDIESDDENTL